MKRIGGLFLLIVLASISGVAQESGGQSSHPPVPEDHFSTRDQTLINIVKSVDAAWFARDFDGAIRFCDQGINLAPKEPGFWANKTSALMQRAGAKYYQGRTSSEAEVKGELIEAAREDIRAALITSSKTLDLVKALPTPSEPILLDVYQFQQVLALRLRAQALYLVTTLVDESYASLALSAIEDYVAAEADEQEKLIAQLHAGEMLLRTRKFREAFIAYQKILLNDSNNADANLGAAVSLIDLGFAANEKASLEQGLDYLSRFVDRAPAKHPIRGSAEQALHYLKQAKSPLTYPRPAGTVAGSRVPSENSVATTSPIVGGVLNGKALGLPKPPYPSIARFARAQGSVPVRVVIDVEGNVIQAQAESGHPLLQAVAVAAAREAKFSPTLLSGRAVQVMGIIVYNFVAQ
jgi:TonB family protein